MVKKQGMSDAERVLHVVTSMDRGGLETMIMNYYRHIDRSRFQFDFLTHRTHEGDYDREIRELGGRIYHVPPVNPFSRKYINELDRFFQDHTYKVVHSHIDCMSAYPLRAAQRAGVPKRIAHAHNTSQNKNLKYFVKLYAKGQIAKYATDLFACGSSAGEWMYDGKPFEVLNNAIDASIYRYNKILRSEVCREFQLESKLVIGHVGSLTKRKNHSFLLEVFKEIQKTVPESRLLLVGDGEDREQLEQKAEEMKLADCVIFTGIRNDVERLLQAVDVFVFPSLFEGLPLALIEAQAAGLPCIVSDTVSRECRITDNLSFLSLKRSAKDWAAACLQAVDAKREDTYSIIQKSGYDVKTNVKRLEAFYQTGFLCEE